MQQQEEHDVLDAHYAMADATAHVDPPEWEEVRETPTDQPLSPEELFSDANNLFDCLRENTEQMLETLKELEDTFKGDTLAAKIAPWYPRFEVLKGQVHKAQGEFVNICDEFFDREAIGSAETFAPDVEASSR